MLHKPGETRWLSNSEAFSSVIRDLKSLLDTLDDIGWEVGTDGKLHPAQADAVGLFHVSMRPYTIAGLYFQNQTLEILAQFSKILQSAELSLVQVPRILKGVKEDLQGRDCIRTVQLPTGRR